jgi:HEAT repeat protein
MHPASSKLAAAALGVAALAAGATLASRREPSVPLPPVVEAGRPSLMDRACPLVRSAEAPPSAPMGSGAACSVTGAVRAASAKGDAMTAEELAALRSDIERALLEQRAECAPALAHELSIATDCGLVYDAVAIRLLTRATSDARFSASQLQRPSKCQWKMISALRESERVEPVLVREVVKAIASPDGDVHGAAWLTLGALGRVAGSAGQPDVVACIDRLLASELALGPDRPDGKELEERSIVVSAAGNAGCEGCRPKLHELVGSADARVRRGAVSALRFLGAESDVETLCRIGRSDGEASVRGAAAFALRHSDSFVEKRLKCLFDMATEDASESVARDAVGSLAALAENETLGVGTLVEVAKQSTRPSTKKLAIEALRGFASDQAIREALSEP